MRLLFIALSTLVLSCIFISCDREPDFVAGQFDDSVRLLVENERIVVYFQENSEEVKLIVEDIMNISDNREDEYPELDFLSLRVDVNNNNLPDNNLDKSYGIRTDGEPCMQFILQEGGAGTGCFQEEGYTIASFFRTTESASEEHIVYELIIRKSNLFDNSDTVGLIFGLSGTDTTGSVPNQTSPLFNETIKFVL